MLSLQQFRFLYRVRRGIMTSYDEYKDLKTDSGSGGSAVTMRWLLSEELLEWEEESDSLKVTMKGLEEMIRSFPECPGL